MKKRALLIAILAATLTSAAWAGDKVDPKAAFEKMKTLAGSWNGQGPQGMATPVSYQVSANGSVVMETLFAGLQAWIPPPDVI
jgi:opacity protein-like surface antigen